MRAPAATTTTQRLALGLSEANPHLFAPGALPAGFGPWRDRVVALHPTYYRLFVDWAKLDEDLARPQDGCVRGIAPCGTYAGVRAQLQALAARGARDPGRWNVMVVLYGVPERFAQPPGGCELPGTEPRARPLSDAGVAAYRGLIRRVLALGRQTGVALRWWSPWNEPNHPTFISPQRAACDAASPGLAPALYARLADAAIAELADDGLPRDLVLGELAGYDRSTPRQTGIGDFVAALPDALVCAASVWSVHDYAQPDQASPDAVGALEAALGARPCTAGKPVWVTETGAGGPTAGAPRGTDPAVARAACRAQAASLARWDADARVGAVFQYSFREDPAYPVGLVDAALTHAYPAYGLWRAWASTLRGAPAPALPVECRD